MPLQRVVEKLAQQQLMAHIDMTQHLGGVPHSTSPGSGLMELHETSISCYYDLFVTCNDCHVLTPKTLLG